MAKTAARWQKDRQVPFVIDLPQIDLYKLGVEGLEIAVTYLVKVDEEGHDFTPAQSSLSPTLLHPRLQQFTLPRRRKGLPEIIDMTKQFQCYTNRFSVHFDAQASYDRLSASLHQRSRPQKNKIGRLHLAKE